MGTPNSILDGLPMILIEEFKPRTGGEIGVVFHRGTSLTIIDKQTTM
jgi:hypothetical protein